MAEAISCTVDQFAVRVTHWFMDSRRQRATFYVANVSFECRNYYRTLFRELFADGVRGCMGISNDRRYSCTVTLTLDHITERT